MKLVHSLQQWWLPLLFLFRNSEMSPSCDGDTSITCIASSASDAQVIIVTHSAIANIIWNNNTWINGMKIERMKKVGCLTINGIVFDFVYSKLSCYEPTNNSIFLWTQDELNNRISDFVDKMNKIHRCIISKSYKIGKNILWLKTSLSC